jgi:glycosyltransferase involved in cell wall biosynthesis
VKVLFTVPWGERLGGAEVMLHEYVASLDRTRVQPTVVFLRDGEWRRDLQSAGIPTAIVDSGRLREPHHMGRAAAKLAGVLRRRRPHVLVNWSAKTHLYGALGWALSGIDCRVVWWQHNIPQPRWLDRLATLVPAHAIGCSSRAAADRQSRVVPRRRVFVVHPGVTAPSLNGSFQLEPRAHDEVVVGLIGRVQPWKGQDRLVRAIALLRNRGLRVRGLVVGGDAWRFSPGYAHEVRALVVELGLGEAVTLTGQVDDVWPHLLAVDIVVSASQGEPFGIALVEAMAAGRPVVAPAGAGPGEIVADGETGLLVADASPEALAMGIERLVRDATLRRRLGTAARRRYEAMFTVEMMGRTLTAELERIAAG